MNDKDTALSLEQTLRLALEALENWLEFDPENFGEVDKKVITAIKAALANEALERKAENARELGLDYEPLEAKDEPWTPDDTAYRPDGLPQEFIKHEVESPDDWSEWVCPNPDEYFMKCCDCGLVHEVQYRVARYGEGDYCELVDDKDVQAQFRMRRRTTLQQEKNDEKPWVCECGAGSYSACKCVFKAALLSRSDGEAKDEPVQNQLMALIDENQRLRAELKFNTTPPQRKPLTDEEIVLIVAECAASHQHTDIHFARAIEAKLKEKNT